MENVPPPSVQTRSTAWVWILAAVLLLCALLACCLVIAAALGAFFWTPWSVSTAPAAATAVVTVQAPPSARLDRSAEPVYGSASLQRGFSPDPYTLQVKAGGPLDTGLECGFTTSSPTFRFSLGGGASETFLRILFRARDYTDSSLLVHAPDGAWYCMTAPDGEPFNDFELAPSGEYSLWVGTLEKGAAVEGTLYITQSQDFFP